MTSGRKTRALLAAALLAAALPSALRALMREPEAPAYVVTRYVRNTGPKPLSVWVEPWANELRVPPGATIRFVGRAEHAGDFEMERTEQGVSVYAWPSAVLTAYSGERQVLDCPEPVPGIPGSSSTASFVKSMFGGQNKTAKGNYPPCELW